MFQVRKKSGVADTANAQKQQDGEVFPVVASVAEAQEDSKIDYSEQRPDPAPVLDD